jgi:hypothetical protein
VLWGKPEYLERYLDLLHIANHEPLQLRIGKRIITVETGKIVLKSEELSRRWNCSKSTFKRYINFLIENKLCDLLCDPLCDPLKVLFFNGFSEDRAAFLENSKNSDPLCDLLCDPLNFYLTLYIKRKKKSKPKEKRKVSQDEDLETTPKTAATNSFKTWGSEELKNSMREANKITQLQPEDLHSFYDYWTEPSASGKPRYQRENTWATLGRLRTWARNLQNFTK